MPTYIFRKKDTEEEFEVFCTLAEREEWLKDPNIEQVPASPGFSHQYQIKPNDGFNSLLKHIKKDHRNSTIKTY